MTLEDFAQVISIGERIEKLGFASFCIKKKEQHIVLNLPRSSARIIIVLNSMGLGLEDCDSGCNELFYGNPRSRVRVTRFYFKVLPPQTQDLHGFFELSRFAVGVPSLFFFRSRSLVRADSKRSFTCPRCDFCPRCDLYPSCEFCPRCIYGPR